MLRGRRTSLSLAFALVTLAIAGVASGTGCTSGSDTSSSSGVASSSSSASSSTGSSASSTSSSSSSAASSSSGSSSSSGASSSSSGSSTSSSSSSSGTGGATQAFGYAAHIEWQADPDAYIQLAVDGGATTLRDDVSWAWIETSPGNYDWSATDDLVTRAANHGIHLLLIVDTAPSWASGISPSTPDWFWYPPQNASDYGSFAGQVAARYGATGTFWSTHPSVPKVLPAGIELWNEPNLVDFWQSGPDPAAYAAMLAAAYPAIKAQDPNMLVVSAGLAPHGGYDDVDCDAVPDTGADGDGMSAVNFLEAVYESGGGGFFDALGMHPYNFWSGATAAQMLSYHPCSAWSQMNDTTPSLRSLMIAKGDGAKRIWATELGAPTCIAGASYTCIDESAQADLATQEIALWRSYAFAGNYYWYDLRDDSGGASTTDREQHFGTVRGDNSLKPAYDALHTAYTP